MQAVNATLTQRLKNTVRYGVVAWLCVALPAWAQGLHTPFSELLAVHVKPINDGHSTEVDYRALAKSKAQLTAYLSSLADIKQSEFERWSEAEQLAFLINAYNGYTLALILEHYDDITTIKDIGGFFSSPWKQAVAPLLGKARTLDEIEHSLIRGDNRYNEPRIHFAVNCASVGCPALRNEAYTAQQLDTQLQHQTQRFLTDNSRNYVSGNVLHLSKIFDWYQQDFEQGFRGTHTVQEFVALYAAALPLDESQVKRLQNNAFTLAYTDYNWALNDTK